MPNPSADLEDVMFDSVLSIGIVQGPVIVTIMILAAGAFLYLLLRKPTLSWAATASVTLAAAAAVAVIVVWLVVDVFNTFGMVLGFEVTAWTMATFAAVGLAILNLWDSAWWRKTIAGIAIVVFLLAGTLGINAYFGLNRTLGSLLNISAVKPLSIPGPIASPSASPSPLASPVVQEPLWKSWVPPANMPAKGRTGAEVIPGVKSGFKARPAGIYLPPAALVANPPPLPLVVMMMGQPGVPDPAYVAGVLDSFASKHNGLAPIVIVADQLGSPYVDPACANSAKYGNVETYITQDVVNWAVAH
ncbi:MAG: alpha/beta hydrolase, partial [Microbacteriaceae bacterium]